MATLHPDPVLGITRSLTGQPWHWRGAEGDRREADLQPDDLVALLLLSRGVPRDDLERHRAPTIRGCMPDPSVQASGTTGFEPNQTDRSDCTFELSVCSIHM